METGAAVTGVHTALRGRADECGLLDSILADIRRGDGRSLVLRGEASMGKTALLQYLIGSAPDMTVLRAVGVEAEMELVYAGLHRLCGPIRGRLVAQERQIAEPARDGLSNRERGARFFLSPRTVEWHLRHVFAKLGIRSRRELAKALPKSSSEMMPA
jgi:DNA-binding CsgD family transcriptional regulator